MGNESGIEPDANTDLFVNADAIYSPLLSSNRLCRSVSLPKGKSLTITSGYNLAVTGPSK
jgi:hypothetical protein